MSIHSEIKRLRLAREWSHQRLADEVAARMGPDKKLSWQTVQQWEREDGTAPNRSRINHVAAALGTTVPALLAGVPPIPPALRVGKHGVIGEYVEALMSPRSPDTLVDLLREHLRTHNQTRRGQIGALLVKLAAEPENDEVAAELVAEFERAPSKQAA